MNKSDSKTRGRSMVSVCVVFALIALCGIDQAKAQNPWTTNGNNIYNSNTGNVGIGTAAPLDNLHLFSPSSIFQMAMQGGLNNSGFIGYWNPGGLFLSNNRNIRTGNNFNTGLPGAQIVLGNSGDGNTGDISFQTISSGIVGTPLELVRMKSNGNIGIGTANPAKRLHVFGSNSQLFMDRAANTAGNYALVNFGTNGADKFLIGMNADASPGADKLSIFESAFSATTPVMTITGWQRGCGDRYPRIQIPCGR